MGARNRNGPTTAKNDGCHVVCSGLPATFLVLTSGGACVANATRLPRCTVSWTTFKSGLKVLGFRQSLHAVGCRNDEFVGVHSTL